MEMATFRDRAGPVKRYAKAPAVRACYRRSAACANEFDHPSPPSWGAEPDDCSLPCYFDTPAQVEAMMLQRASTRLLPAQTGEPDVDGAMHTSLVGSSPARRFLPASLARQARAARGVPRAARPARPQGCKGRAPGRLESRPDGRCDARNVRRQGTGIRLSAGVWQRRIGPCFPLRGV